MRALLDRFLPVDLRRRIAQWRHAPAWLRASRAKNETSIVLDKHVLDELSATFEEPPPYGYDPEAVRRRGDIRARELMDLHGGSIRPDDRRSLELGCYDGMVSACLTERGFVAWTTDLSAKGFDPRLGPAGVKRVVTDGEALPFPDGYFDLVFSYDVLEHLRDPEQVLREAARVLRPGGLIYFASGPLYPSPYGLHALRATPVPYCQFLFSEEVMREVEVNGPGPFPWVNGWSIRDYRRLWKRLEDVLVLVRSREGLIWEFCDVIAKYPGCFREGIGGHTGFNLEDLTTPSVKVLFRRR
ncbi:MAG: class I SAM-dependent methyltransferase [Acidobacteriota bacterium]